MEQRTKYGNIDTKHTSTALKPAKSYKKTVNPLNTVTLQWPLGVIAGVKIGTDRSS